MKMAWQEKVRQICYIATPAPALSLFAAVPSFEHNPALMMLCLDTNQLIGTLPSFSNNPKLMCLDAHSNKLSGTVRVFALFLVLLPTVIGLFRSFHVQIPSFSKNKMLQKLTLRNNSFSGSLEDFEENLKLRVLCVFLSFLLFTHFVIFVIKLTAATMMFFVGICETTKCLGRSQSLLK